MSGDQLLALIMFAFAGTFTPGPNTTIATITGANFGLRAAVPHMLGVPVGFATMLLAAAAGAAAIVLAFPFAAQVLKWAGVAYLIWLALMLARSSTSGLAQLSGPFKLPLTFVQSAAFQYLNPKAWMLSVATAGAFFAGDSPLTRGALAAVVFGIAATASIAVWASIGAALRGWLSRGARLRIFNVVMGLLLGATALWMALAQ
ncbi:MAG: LysE family translocator [Burkholderiaceae bacterium]|nr:LysE family translocator [Burkholderiaceae bacterium]